MGSIFVKISSVPNFCFIGQISHNGSFVAPPLHLKTLQYKVNKTPIEIPKIIIVISDWLSTKFQQTYKATGRAKEEA